MSIGKGKTWVLKSVNLRKGWTGEGACTLRERKFYIKLKKKKVKKKKGGWAVSINEGATKGGLRGRDLDRQDRSQHHSASLRQAMSFGHPHRPVEKTAKTFQ